MTRSFVSQTVGTDLTAILSHVGSMTGRLDLGPDPLPAPPAVEVPGYEVIRELGRGGMGVVYLAKHLRLGRLVALKTVLAHRLAGTDDRARFRQECESVARLNHPNVCQVYEVGEAGGTLYAAFEYVAGGTLAQRLSAGPLAPQDAARLVATLARAVQFAHDRGIVHRDLKPGNILISEPGTRKADRPSGPRSEFRDPSSEIDLKVTDFGLAKRLDADSHLTRTGTACGTPNYMAPEQIRGQRGAVGVAADVYGLGGILHECLTGRPPFVGDNAMAVMQAVLTQDPPPLRKWLPAVPRDLDVVAQTCLEKLPARRYATAGELADDLDRYLAGEPILARPVSPVERGVRWAGRNPAAAGLIAVLAAAFGIVTGFAWELQGTLARERQVRAEVAQKNAALEMAIAQALAAEATATAAREAADRHAAAALAAKDDAAREAAAARTQTRRADANAAAANDGLALGFAAVDRLLTRFAADPRFADSDFVDLRNNLLRDTQDLFDRLASRRDTTAVAAVRAMAGYRLGRLVARTGDSERGSGLIFESWLRLKELAEAADAPPETLYAFAEIALGWLELHAEADDLARIARDYFLEQSRRAVARAMAKEPKDPRGPDILLRCHTVEAAIAATDGEPARRDAALRAAVDGVTAQIHRAGPTAEATKRLRDLRLRQAIAAAAATDPATDQLFRNVVRELEPQYDPAQPTRHGAGPPADLANARRHYAEYLIAAKHPSEARTQSAAAADVMRLLERHVPDFRAYRILYGEVLATAAKATAADGGDADTLYTEAESQLARVWKDGHGNYRASAAMVETQMHFVNKAMEAKEWTAAGDRLVKAAAAKPTGNSPNEVFTVNAALCYARGKDELKMRGASDRLYRHEHVHGVSFFYLARAWLVAGDVSEAAAAVKRAAGLGYFTDADARKQFDTDPLYAPIRARLDERDYRPDKKK